MFIVETDPQEEGARLLKRVKRFIGHIPPHFELFATIHPKRFEMFLNEILYLTTHKQIDPDFFIFLRFYIAAKEGLTYCHDLNKALLLSKGYLVEQISAMIDSYETLPLDDRHQSLFAYTLKAINTPSTFGVEDIDALKALSWDDSDIYDAIDHGAFLYKSSKVLNAYAK